MWRDPSFEFEFARPPLAWRLCTLPGCLLLGIAMIGLGWVWHEQAETAQALDTLQQRVSRLTQQTSPGRVQAVQVAPAVPTPVVRLSAEQQKEARKMAKLLTVRWFDLLQALEARQVEQVALLQLTPDADRGQFVLTGEAKDYQSLLRYVGSLQQAAALHAVHLHKHQVNEAHPQRPVSFEVQGGWQP